MNSLQKGLVVLSLLAAATVPSVAQLLPVAPIRVNRADEFTQIGEKGRIVIDWDVSAIPSAADCLVRVYSTKKPPGSEPVKQYTFKGVKGSQRITFNDLPIAVYRVFGTPLDREGHPLRGGERAVFVEYGGPQAWEAYEKAPNGITADNATRPPFDNLSFKATASGPTMALDPPSLVLNPGHAGEITLSFNGLALDEPVDWKLEGRGHLRVLSNHRAIYVAERKARVGLAATITARARRLPAVSSTMSVVITEVNTGQLMR